MLGNTELSYGNGKGQLAALDISLKDSVVLNHRLGICFQYSFHLCPVTSQALNAHVWGRLHDGETAGIHIKRFLFLALPVEPLLCGLPWA